MGGADYIQNQVLFKTDGSSHTGGENIYNGLRIINFGIVSRPTPAAGEAMLSIDYFPERTASYYDQVGKITGEIPIVFTRDGVTGAILTCQAE